MEAAEVAAKALEILDRDGWCKGYLTMPDGGGQHCVAGAWNLAHHQGAWWGAWWGEGSIAELLELSYIQPLEDTIKAQFPDFCPGNSGAPFIAEWNNWPQTTEADVRMVLEKIAAG